MLVLSRKKEETIIINGVIRIKVVDLGNDVVKLGIEAPKNVKIYREEIWKSIQEENLSAVQHAPDGATSNINKNIKKLSREPNREKIPELAGVGVGIRSHGDEE